ncbi:hypothetical protein UP09_05530 [Bradyrhizobium sp. LTSP885]|nr:hypothetical protein UP09_05530 [Bradyrhizobium sp. LTSP885]
MIDAGMFWIVTNVRNGMPPAKVTYCQGRRVNAHEFRKRPQSLHQRSHLRLERFCAPVISVKAENPKLAHFNPEK